MSVTHTVKGAAVVLRAVGGSAQYLYKGAVLDSSKFEAHSIEHATTQGLIVEIEAPAEVVEIEAPDKSWTVEKIDAFAAEWDIALPPDAKKDEKLAAIAAEIDKRTAEFEAQGA